MKYGTKSAERHWGAAYEKIPKSAFAIIAWHLANIVSDSADAPGAAEAAFVREALILMEGGILHEEHFKLISRNVKEGAVG